MLIDNLDPLCQFLRYVLAGVALANPHHRAPETTIGLHGLCLGNQKDRVAYVPGAELTPVLVEFDTLPQGDGPAFAIRRHLPLLREFRDICSSGAVDAHQVL